MFQEEAEERESCVAAVRTESWVAGYIVLREAALYIRVSQFNKLPDRKLLLPMVINVICVCLCTFYLWMCLHNTFLFCD